MPPQGLRSTSDRDLAEPRTSTLFESDERFRLLVEGVRDYAIFLLDPTGRVISWNAGAERLKGYRAEEILGKSFHVFYPPEAIDTGWPDRELEFARAEGRFEDEGWRVRKDGSLFWANVVITAVRTPDGVLQGYSKVTRDLTERRRHEEELRISEERFRLLVEAVYDYALFVLDPDGRVVSWNAGAARIKGYSATEAIGMHLSRFYPPEDQDRPYQDLARALAEGKAESEGWRVRKDGSRFWAGTSLSALRDADGTVTGFAKVTRDLTERRRVESLEASGRRMNEFLAMLSHELRNPLAPIQNALHAMRLRGVEDPGLRWSQAVIERQVSHLQRLVDDLLDVSRLTSGNIRLTREPVELAVVLDRAVEIAKPVIDARRHHLEVSLSDQPLLVRGDLHRLTQVVSNLLHNSAKFTPEGGRILLSLSQSDRDAVIRVRDNGIGIAPGDLATVFESFAQLAQTPDRSLGGLGIGLTLVRRLVRMHGGSVEAKSDGIGHGSEFVVRLPLLVSDGRPALPEHEEPPAVQPRKITLRVLVVDDNRDSADTMAMLLGMWGHQVSVVHDGAEVLARVREFQPHLVLLDIGLPGATGYELATQVRSSLEGQSPVLAAMTGYGQDEDRARARAAGFDHHLTKPVDFEKLALILAEVPDA
jgi:PAS domain S-box-containing protein